MNSMEIFPPREPFAVSGVVTDPSLLQKTTMGYTVLKLKSTVGTSNDSSLAGFWTDLDAIGSYAALTTADTYVTVVDISGSSGVIPTIIGPLAGTSNLVTFKFTVDGKVTEVTASVSAVADRSVLGALDFVVANISSAAVDTSDLTHSGGSLNPGADLLDGYRDANESLVSHPDDAIRDGNLIQGYKRSIKIEVKCAVVLAGIAGYAGVTQKSLG